MEKSDNTSERAQSERFRGPSGWEGSGLESESSGRRVLAGGIFCAALLVIAVIFFVSPSATPGLRPNIALRCIDNSECEHLNGDCCPTPFGDRLACCKDIDNRITPAIIPSQACDSNSVCAKAGLLGSCCPNTDGIQLACCTNANNTVLPPRSASAMCANNPGCKRLGLTEGACCPPDSGSENLDCCPPITTNSPALTLYSFPSSSNKKETSSWSSLPWLSSSHHDEANR